MRVLIIIRNWNEWINKKRNPVWSRDEHIFCFSSRLYPTGSVLSAIEKILSCKSSRLSYMHVRPKKWFQTSEGLKTTPCGAPSPWNVWTCPYTSTTLEGSGTISQFGKVTVEKSPSKATPRSMSAKLTDNQLSIYTIFFEDIWMRIFFLPERNVVHTKKLDLSCWLSSWRVELCIKPHKKEKKTCWGTLGPSLLVNMCSEIVKDSARQHWHKRQRSFPRDHVHPTPQHPHPCKTKTESNTSLSSLLRTHDNNDKKNKNETSVNSPASYRDKNTRINLAERFLVFCFVCVCRQSQVKCPMIRRCHKATTVHGCRSLQGSTPLLSW